MADRHVLGLSGGKDSAALAIHMREKHPELDITYFFTDTGKELPETHEFLSKLEGFLNKPILRLNPGRDFDFWLRQFNYFLPSARTRWCTTELKLKPFRKWVTPWLDAGDTIYSYVAIRADEEHREGYTSNHENLKVVYPFRDDSIDKAGVMEILDGSGLGLPAYYEWRSRSGCTFCFFQRKIEWIELMRRHPEAFEEAKRYEKQAIENASPFMWLGKDTPLETLENPKRIQKIEEDFRKRKEKDLANRRINPLAPSEDHLINLDDLYLDDDESPCLVCHK